MPEPERFFVFATFAKYKYRYICYIPDPLRSFSTPPWLLPYSLKLFAFFRLVFHALKLRHKTSSASRRASSELNVASGIILKEFSRNGFDVLPYFSSSMGVSRDRGCLLSRQRSEARNQAFRFFFSTPRSGISIDVLTELFIANQQFCISRFAPSSGNMHTSEVLLDFPKKYRF